MGGLAGSQSRQHPSVMINSTRADITTISCMVASQYGRWARSRYSGEAGAASPVCCLTCSKPTQPEAVCQPAGAGSADNSASKMETNRGAENCEVSAG